MLGVKQDVAEVQAQELEIALGSILEQTRQETKQSFENKELATKGDIAIIKADIEKLKFDIEKVKVDIEKLKLELQKEIAEASTKIIIWVSGLFGGFSVFFLGILAKGFHWI